MTDKRTSKQPLEPRSDNPSLNERLHVATELQSPVTPDDYPEEDQVAAATGRPRDGVPDKTRP